MRFFRTSILALLVMVSLALVTQARENRHSDPGPHPLKLLKVERSSSQEHPGMGPAKGNMDIWIQNAADADVDKVKIEVELFSPNGRFLDKVVKDIGIIKANSRCLQTVRWDIVDRGQGIKQKIWIFYNGGKEKLIQFEADAPV